MTMIVKAALLQTDWAGTKVAMLDKHEQAVHDAKAQGAQVMCFQELFYGPYFCQVQDAEYYEYTEQIPDGPTTQRFQRLAKETGMVLVLPMYEVVRPGLYYNTAAVIDADGTYLGKYRKQHIPQTKGFWEKFYFVSGDGGYPIFETAVGKVGVYICYDRHFPEGWRALGLNGAEIVFNPSATSRGLSQYLWKLEQPAAAVANMFYVGAINRGASSRWATTTSTGRATSSTRKASSSARWAIRSSRSWWCATSISRRSSRCAIVGRSIVIVARTPTKTCSSAESEPGDHMSSTLIKNGKVISSTGVIAHDVLIDGETIRALGAPGYFTEEGVDRVIGAAGKYVIPGGVDVHTHMELPFGGTFASDTFETGSNAAAGWHHHHHRHGRAALRRERARRPRRVAPQGRRQLQHRLLVPPDHRWRRRPVAEGHEVPRRARGHQQLQAVHGLPGRVLQRRRPDPEGDADRSRVRGDDHDACRERHRHRRARAAGPRPRRHRPPVPQLHPAVTAGGRGHASPSCSATWPATCPCTSCT